MVARDVVLHLSVAQVAQENPSAVSFQVTEEASGRLGGWLKSDPQRIESSNPRLLIVDRSLIVDR